MAREVRFKIFLDGSWTDWMTAEETRKYKFSKCIMQETMTRAEYDKIYEYPMENKNG